MALDDRPLLPPRKGASLLKTVLNSLTYPFGVGTLSPKDPEFYPYIHRSRRDGPVRPHDGPVWSWLTGAVVTALVRYHRPDLAFQLTKDQARYLVGEGLPGALPEILEAAPRHRRRKPRPAGSPVKVAPVAEFVRNWYQDYLGATPDAQERRFKLAPTLPPEVGHARFTLHIKDHRVAVEYRQTKEDFRCNLACTAGDGPVYYEFVWREGVRWFDGLLLPGETADLRIDRKSADLFVDGRATGWQRIQFNTLMFDQFVTMISDKTDILRRMRFVKPKRMTERRVLQ